MTSCKRVGNALLAFGGCVLAALMVYNLFHDGAAGVPWGGWGRARVAAEVVVFFPERPLWTEFHQAVDACHRRRIVRVVGSGEEWIEVETPRHARRIRFVLNDVRGVRETKEAVDRIAGRPTPPVALVGSSNTLLTVALADALRQSARQGREGPLLLVPWATTVLCERAEPGRGPVALLDIDPDRTFRFCPNNQTQADTLTHALLHHDAGQKPTRVEAIVDRLDPYSVDLADSFHRTIERWLPSTELVERGETVHFSSLWNSPGLLSVEEEALAESIWNTADQAGHGATHWVVLPLQAEPAQRMLLALQRHARGHTSEGSRGPLRVLCGDGTGLETLRLLAGKLPFPVWCYSPGLAPGTGSDSVDPVLYTDVAVLAELIAAVAHGLDVDGVAYQNANSLRERLRNLNLPSRDQATLGRSIALAPSGERTGDDLGHVLLIRPGDASVYAMGEDALGKWSSLRPVAPTVGAGKP
ncbi:MAG: hypothetical protein P4L84_36735 [Isosphaeraceae bacterium]|nr:hypothetical protein [Isosphaeraceae bacterium]